MAAREFIQGSDLSIKLRSPNVLVVEDHAHTRAYLALLLDALGYRYELACDGAEALAMASRALFDALLTDVYMPGMDGWELVHQLDASGRLPVLVISMSAGRLNTEVTRSRAAGCHAHLQKPLLVEELGQSLKRPGTFAPDQEPSSARWRWPRAKGKL